MVYARETVILTVSISAYVVGFMECIDSLLLFSYDLLDGWWTSDKSEIVVTVAYRFTSFLYGMMIWNLERGCTEVDMVTSWEWVKKKPPAQPFYGLCRG